MGPIWPAISLESAHFILPSDVYYTAYSTNTLCVVIGYIGRPLCGSHRWTHSAANHRLVASIDRHGEDKRFGVLLRSAQQNQIETSVVCVERGRSTHIDERDLEVSPFSPHRRFPVLLLFFSFLHLQMESTGATFCFVRSAFPPTAVKDARLLFASGGRWRRPLALPVVVAALDKGPGASGNGGRKTGGGGVPNSNYVVPLDLTPSFIRPLKEILRDLNKRVPDNIINAADNSVPWYLPSLSSYRSSNSPQRLCRLISPFRSGFSLDSRPI
ncbi:hypothetical protein GW17_00022954 [Ensete ventricosum]|nr:hypothetical protein GW17_00022954 [Ensete ventricosum]